MDLIDKRNEYYKLKTKYPENKQFHGEFLKYKTKVRNTKNHLKKQHIAKEIENSLNDNRKLWANLNEIVFRKAKKNEKIKTLNIDNKIIIDSQEMANIFNNYFINIIKTNDASLPNSQTRININKPFELNHCTVEETENIIMALNSNSANGIDNISTKFLKRYSHILAKPISRYINESMKDGKFPNALKIGNVIRIHKKGNKENCNNYRPITKLSAIDKVFEETILIRLKTFFKENNIIHEKQYGFVEKSDTLSATLNCIEKIYASVDKKKYVAVLSIDLEKAFDSVNHKNLLYKLSKLGINDIQMKLFESFLLDRKQVTTVNGEISTEETSRNGVPQGSKISATAFLLYINEMLNLPLKSSAQLYADDGLLISVAESFDQLITDLLHDMDLIYNWYEKNQFFKKKTIKKKKLSITIVISQMRTIFLDLTTKIS